MIIIFIIIFNIHHFILFSYFNKLTYHMHNIIKYTASKDNSNINDKAFIYRKMSTKIDYVAARE